MYIEQADFALLIQQQQLIQLVGVSGQSQIDFAVEIAMAEVQSYLIQKYDMVEEFSLTGTARSLQTRMAVVDVALYILHSRIAPTNIPELRQKRYDQVIAWLKGCARGHVTPQLKEIDIDTTGSRIRSGFDPKQPNKY